MILHERIQSCRKQTGLSQEALAEQLGVSRQAISKWELGDAEPELKNLQQLSRVFGVSTDYLLGEDPPQPSASTDAFPGWIDNLPKFLGGILRRFGWLAGVYVSLIGGFIIGIGGVMYAFLHSMLHSYNQSVGSIYQQFPGMGSQLFPDAAGPADGLFGMLGSSGFESTSTALPGTDIMGGVCVFMMVFGALVLIGGVILAIMLKKYSKSHE